MGRKVRETPEINQGLTMKQLRQLAWNQRPSHSMLTLSARDRSEGVERNWFGGSLHRSELNQLITRNAKPFNVDDIIRELPPGPSMPETPWKDLVSFLARRTWLISRKLFTLTLGQIDPRYYGNLSTQFMPRATSNLSTGLGPEPMKNEELYDRSRPTRPRKPSVCCCDFRLQCSF